MTEEHARHQVLPLAIFDLPALRCTVESCYVGIDAH